jgi:hypothetical protein
VSARLPTIAARFGELGFTTVDVDPRGYRRGSLLGEHAANA